MAIYIHPANFIFDKRAVASRYIGGIDAFRKQFITETEPYNQEDMHLFSVSRWNTDELDLDELVAEGLRYDPVANSSPDFTILARYYGLSWRVDWLELNNVFAWHVDASADERKEVQRICTMKMDEIAALQEQGTDLLSTINAYR